MINRFKPKSEFSRNILTLMTGTTIAQAIPIAISPILTRIYSPEDFGVFALYLSAVMLFGSLVAGRYELAILLPKRNHHAKLILMASVIISLLVSLILLLFIIFFIDDIVFILKSESIRYWLYLAPFNVFLVSIINSLNYWYNREKKYGVMSNANVVRSSVQGFSNIILGFFAKISAGLIIGTFLGGITSLLFLLKKGGLVFGRNTYNKQRLLALLKKYIRFPKYMVVSGLLENLSSQMPVFLIGALFSTSFVGFYSLSQRIIRVPIMLIGSSIGQVFRQQASHDLNEHGTCRPVFIKTLRTLVYISTIPFLVFFILAPDFFALVFGSEWRVAGDYAQIMTVLFYLQFITSPVSSMFMIAQKQNYDLYMQIYLVISVTSSFYLGYYVCGSIIASLYVFTFAYSLKYIFELIMSYRFTVSTVKT